MWLPYACLFPVVVAAWSSAWFLSVCWRLPSTHVLLQGKFIDHSYFSAAQLGSFFTNSFFTSLIFHLCSVRIHADVRWLIVFFLQSSDIQGAQSFLPHLIFFWILQNHYGFFSHDNRSFFALFGWLPKSARRLALWVGAHPLFSRSKSFNKQLFSNAVRPCRL